MIETWEFRLSHAMMVRLTTMLLAGILKHGHPITLVIDGGTAVENTHLNFRGLSGYLEILPIFLYDNSLKRDLCYS